MERTSLPENSISLDSSVLNSEVCMDFYLSLVTEHVQKQG